ncbi:hypothetical protein GGR95_000839 [Sulfitobacter undariae]|uniref:YcxB-like protein n=1 Tax=Sulfitobacter undariae TaxID=1563671 RepID=A0A7W6GYV1_9RHOB|nr:hypothetical protein [Sulfitobacter undariae]MBB3993211.1 hypothetical protein [Sulfitobacter undariae]
MTQYTLTYEIAPEMLHRAMLSWAQPVRSRRAKMLRVVLGAVGFVVLVAAIVVLLQYDIVSRGFLLGGLIGFYAGLILWYVIHRTSTLKLVGFSDAAMKRQGMIETVFCADHVTMTTQISKGRMDWRFFDDVSALTDATVLRAGAMVYAVPDAALPHGVSPAAFRDDLIRWREAGI